MHTLQQSSSESISQAACDFITTTPALAKAEMHHVQNLAFNVTDVYFHIIHLI